MADLPPSVGQGDRAGRMVVVTTAGDLWKAYAEGMLPCFQSSGISLRSGGNTPIITCTDDAAEARRTALDRAQALLTVEGGDKTAAMEKLIARVQLQAGMDKAHAINLPLAEFVAVLTAQKPRSFAYGGPLANVPPKDSPGEPTPATNGKRSTERGEGRAKLIAALTMHHKYADGGCLNLEPIGNNELARLAGVSESTASAFFNKEFNGGTSGGYGKYRAVCSDATPLVAAMKLLNQEYSPYHLFGAKPANESERDDDV